MGADYLQKGDIDNAIARFKSSVDLDENIFESRYNLGVAYIQKENFEDAIAELEAAVKLKPNSKDALYSLGVAFESEGLKFEINPADENQGEENLTDAKIARDDVIEGLVLVKKGIASYKNYLSLTENTEEKAKIEAHITELNETISKYKEEYEITDDELLSSESVSNIG